MKSEYPLESWKSLDFVELLRIRKILKDSGYTEENDDYTEALSSYIKFLVDKTTVDN